MKWISRSCWLLPAIAVLAVLSLGPETYAGKRRGLLRRAGPHTQRAAPSYNETYKQLNERYPKYFGGFHSSYYENMGIPTGDIGLRGNSIYQTPW